LQPGGVAVELLALPSRFGDLNRIGHFFNCDFELSCMMSRRVLPLGDFTA
jgi:hypothetical protein